MVEGETNNEKTAAAAQGTGLPDDHPYSLMATASSFVLMFHRADGQVMTFDKGDLCSLVGLVEMARLRLNRKVLEVQTQNRNSQVRINDVPQMASEEAEAPAQAQSGGAPEAGLKAVPDSEKH